MTKLSNLFFVLLLIASLLTACSVAGEQGFPTELLLVERYLPSGFVRREFVSVDVPNAKALAIGYVVPDGSQFPSVRVSHRLAVYADEQSAQAAYPGWEKEIFPVDDWKTPDDFHFKPTTSGDLYRFGCMPGHFDGQDLFLCRYIQQHNNKISDVFANLDGRRLKLEDVELVLVRLDALLSRAK